VLTERAGLESSAIAIPVAEFANALKGLGTGIQLEACDIELAFGSEEDVTFESFSEYLREE